MLEATFRQAAITIRYSNLLVILILGVLLTGYTSHQASWEFDSTLRYVDSISAVGVSDAYLQLDLRVACSPVEQVSRSLGGHNLVRDQQKQYVEKAVGFSINEPQRGVYAKLV